MQKGLKVYQKIGKKLILLIIILNNPNFFKEFTKNLQKSVANYFKIGML